MSPSRVIAVDWSGAKKGARKRIWLAEAVDSRLIRLEAGRSREELARHLTEEAERDPELVVGLDFAFSLPAWFLEKYERASAPEFWEVVRERGEAWLKRCEPPFWGRPGTTCPELPEHFRATDREVESVGGIRPKSPFQIGGAGAVGTGSLRGMPVLAELRDAGFHVWPFDAPASPLVIEIYPRVLTGPVTKSDAVARGRYAHEFIPDLEMDHLYAMAGSEDAFDAAVSALVMAGLKDSFASLPEVRSDRERREGRIWTP